MKILLTHRYFWPDTPPYGTMLRTIARDLVAAGHAVEVFASCPSYLGGMSAPRREILDGFAVRRTFVLRESKRNPVVRALNVLLYCGALFFRILRARADIVTVASFPPVIAGCVASVACRISGSKLIYHVQDVHPEVSQFSGGRLGRGLVSRVLRALDGRTVRGTVATVALSQDMADTLRRRPGGGGGSIHIINNISVDLFGEARPAPSGLRPEAGRIRIVFAGNLGRFQNLELLAEGIACLFGDHPELELLFLGSGSAEAALRARWGSHPQVRFWPMLPFAEAREVIADSDLGLVSLAPEIYRVSYPSKVLTYIALGLPMLALIEPQSRLAAEIRENALGAVPDAPTPEAIASVLAPFLCEPRTLEDARRAVTAYHETTTATPIVLEKWRRLVEQVGGQE